MQRIHYFLRAKLWRVSWGTKWSKPGNSIRAEQELLGFWHNPQRSLEIAYYYLDRIWRLQANWCAQIPHYLKRHLGQITDGRRKQKRYNLGMWQISVVLMSLPQLSNQDRTYTIYTTKHMQYRLPRPQPGLWALIEAEGTGVGYPRQEAS